MVHARKRKSVFGSTTATPDKDWAPLTAPSPPERDVPTPPASPLRLVALANQSTRKIRTVAWEQHSKPKHVLVEDVSGEGVAAAAKHGSATADDTAQLQLPFWQVRALATAGLGGPNPGPHAL